MPPLSTNQNPAANQIPAINRKVLLVDDDQFLLDMYAIKFNKAGYEVKVADSTMTALKLVREGYVPDVVLSDIVMPDMDGLDFVDTLRKEKLISKAVVIMLTNQGSSDDIARANKLGVDGYIVKATTIPSEVLTQVDKICISKKV